MNPSRTPLPLATAQAIIDRIRPGYPVTDVVARTGGEVGHDPIGAGCAAEHADLVAVRREPGHGGPTEGAGSAGDKKGGHSAGFLSFTS